MTGGYQTIQFGYVKRRFLHAPISMDFKHTLRSYMTPIQQDMRNCVRVDRDDRYDRTVVTFWLGFGGVLRRKSIDNTCIESSSQLFANLQINKAIQDVMESARIPTKIALMREYNRETIHCYTRNRERFATATVKMA